VAWATNDVLHRDFRRGEDAHTQDSGMGTRLDPKSKAQTPRKPQAQNKNCGFSGWDMDIWIYLVVLVFIGSIGISVSYKIKKGTLSSIYHLPTICIIYLRFLGPSNSQNRIPCHVPRTGSLFSIMIVNEGPNRLDLICAAELPSACE